MIQTAESDLIGSVVIVTLSWKAAFSVSFGGKIKQDYWRKPFNKTKKVEKSKEGKIEKTNEKQLSETKKNKSKGKKERKLSETKKDKARRLKLFLEVERQIRLCIVDLASQRRTICLDGCINSTICLQQLLLSDTFFHQHKLVARLQVVHKQINRIEARCPMLMIM